MNAGLHETTSHVTVKSRAVLWTHNVQT